MACRVTRFNSRGRMVQTAEAALSQHTVAVDGTDGQPAGDAGLLAFELSARTGPRSTERIRVVLTGDDLRALLLGVDRLGRARARQLGEIAK